MARPPDPDRREELLEAVIQYLLKHGISELSLRPLARAVGSSGRGLLYHFASKEGLIQAVFSHLRERQRTSYTRMIPPSFLPLSAGCREIWDAMTTPETEAHFRLFLEAYSLALRHPARFRTFLHHVLEDWLQFFSAPLRKLGFSQDDARAIGTVMLSGYRGFMLDYCVSHDRKRLDRAFALWLQALDSLAVPRKNPRRSSAQ